MHYLLGLNNSASIQGIYSIAKGQYWILNTRKTYTNCLPSIKLLLLFRENKDLGFLKIKTCKNRKKQQLQINHRDKAHEIRELQGCAFIVMVI